jgi:glycosyltransferase involved in cell wall biosynthesis
MGKLLSEYYHNVHMLIVGDDLSGRERKYKNKLIRSVKELGLNDKISFSGHCDNIKEVINEIDILVHPAINEPFGRVLIEAMAMEKPVVAYNCGGPKEIIVNNETGFLIEPFDYRALTIKTKELIDNTDLRNSFGKAGRKRVIEYFNSERYIREMEEVFNGI